MGLLDKFRADPRQRFAAQVLAEVRRAGAMSARIDHSEFAIRYQKLSANEEATIYLQNTFASCQGEPESVVRDQIHRLVDTLLHAPAMPTTWDRARDHLRPVLRSMSFGLSTPKGPMGTLVSRPAQPYLQELLVVDQPTSMAYVMEGQLAQWGVTAADAFAAAHANLRAHGAAPKPIDGLVRMIDTGDGYFSSLVLLDGWLAGCADGSGARPVAFIPSNNTVLLVSDAPDLTELFKMVLDEYLEEARSISPVAYTVDDDGRVVEYPEIDGQPASAAVHRAKAMLAATEYNAQKSWLDKEFERDDIDVFVATVNVYQRDDGSAFSIAVWSKDVDTLLPAADYVAFFNEGEPPFQVRWDDVVLRAGLRPEPGYQPDRFRLQAWPEPGVVEELRRLEVKP